MPPELQAAIDGLNKTIADFQDANDRALEQKADKGFVEQALQEKVDKFNADITTGQEKIVAEMEAAAKRQDDLERKINLRGMFGGDGDEAKAVAQGLAFLKKQGAQDPTPEQYQAYQAGLNHYVRLGPNALPAEMLAALSVGADPAGGYHVTPDLGGRMAQLIYESSPMRQIASVQTIGTDALEGYNDLAEAGSGWTSEQAAPAETATPETGKYRIPVHEQYAEPRITQNMLDDADYDVEGWLNQKVSSKLSRVENAAFVTGDGVGKPRGFLTHTAGTPSSSLWNVIQQVNSGKSGAFADAAPADYLISLMAELKTEYMMGSVWTMGRRTFAKARQLKDGQGNYLFSVQKDGVFNFELLGFPVVLFEDMPVLAGDSLSLAFGNFREAYQIVDRQGIRILRDPFTTKPFTKIYTTKRVGGDVINFEAIKIMKFAV